MNDSLYATRGVSDPSNTVERTAAPAWPIVDRDGKQIKLLANLFTLKLTGLDSVVYEYNLLNNSASLHINFLFIFNLHSVIIIIFSVTL